MITVYEGTMGSGMTLTAVASACEEYLKGHKVIVNSDIKRIQLWDRVAFLKDLRGNR